MRINDLARELEVKSKAVLDYLAEIGITDKRSHSSAIEDELAEKVRAHFRVAAPQEQKSVAPGFSPAHAALKGGATSAPLQPDALAKARAAYQDFFVLWKDADPDIPILKKATTEYAKLK